MSPRRRNAAALLCALLLFSNLPVRARQTTPAPQSAPAQVPRPQPTPDPNNPVQRIRDEGLNRSQVMQVLNHLTNVIGPRLTGSPGMKRANEWTRDKLAGWGLVNAKLEPWGPFGRGWVLKKFSADVVEPQTYPLNAYPKAWSPATAGPLTAEVVYVDAKDEQGLQKFKGQLRGRVVLNGAVRDPAAHFEPLGTRRTEKELLDLANAPDPATQPPRPRTASDARAATRFNSVKLNFYQQEGVALVLDPSRGDGGNIFVQQAMVPQPLPASPQAPQALLARAPEAPRQVRAWDKSAPRFAPQVALSIEHYNRLARLIEAGERVRVSVNLDAQFLDEDPMGYNTVAEIPGTDLKDEVVMLGAHLDSWHTATGATDNAAGVSIMMEAVRILKALNLQPRRTVRIALWSGEEQGLLGSRAYVSQHFGPLPAPAPAAAAGATQPDAAAAAVAEKTGQTPNKREARDAAAKTPAAQPTPAAPSPTPATSAVGARYKPEHARLNVYFNADSGAGAIRGVHMQGNEALRPIFRRWLLPFAQLKVGETTYTATTVTAANAGGSDFLSFDAAGLNGIDFLQDELEYGTRTWHSSQDNYDRAIPEDLKQAAVIVAAFVYNAATADAMLPRKPPRQEGTRR
ncbi:MAG TPA: M20/M25/M40 family metallo-hydrolase [Pyrinomonadaceae bacterium]